MQSKMVKICTLRLISSREAVRFSTGESFPDGSREDVRRLVRDILAGASILAGALNFCCRFACSELLVQGQRRRFYRAATRKVSLYYLLI